MKSYNQMIVDYSVTRAKDYNEIDSTLETNDIPDDNEIIAAVQEAPENREDVDKNEGFMVSNKVALESIQNLYNHLQRKITI